MYRISDVCDYVRANFAIDRLSNFDVIYNNTIISSPAVYLAAVEGVVFISAQSQDKVLFVR